MLLFVPAILLVWLLVRLVKPMVGGIAKSATSAVNLSDLNEMATSMYSGTPYTFFTSSSGTGSTIVLNSSVPTNSADWKIETDYQFPDWAIPGNLIIDKDDNIWLIQCEFTEITRNGQELGFLQVVSIDDESIEREFRVGQVEHYF